MAEETGSADTGNPNSTAEDKVVEEIHPNDQNHGRQTHVVPEWLSGIEDTTVRAWAEGKRYPSVEQAMKSAYHAEKVVGADRAGRTVMLLGDEPTPEESAAFYNKLGRPEEASAYGFTAPEGADPAFAESAKTKFHELGLSDKQAVELSGWYNEQATGSVEQTEAQYKQQVADDTAGLQKEWGAAYDKNILAAKAAASTFGLDETQVENMEAALGFGGLMRFMNSIGSKLGEDTLEGNDANVSGVMTPETAKIKMSELTGSKEFMDAWMDRSHPGHAAAVAKKESLSKMIMGQAP